jgi:hypothetical protein
MDLEITVAVLGRIGGIGGGIYDEELGWLSLVF